MKSIITLLTLIVIATSIHAQNVDVGTAVPTQKMHVAGNIRTDNGMIMWPGAFTAAAPNINVQYSTVRITLVAGPQANAVTYSATVAEGQVLFISNEDDDPATFVGITITTLEARAFIYTNGIWRPTSGSGSNNAWLLLGNASTVDGTNFIGTTDNVPFNIKVNNQKAGRIEIGFNANTFLGHQAGNINTGQRNVGIGHNALQNNTSASNNTAIGYYTLQNNTRSSNNTAIGSFALTNNTLGVNNTAVGTVAPSGNQLNDTLHNLTQRRCLKKHDNSKPRRLLCRAGVQNLYH